MAFLGHKTTDEARTYTKKANRKSLSEVAWRRWRGRKGNKFCPTLSKGWTPIPRNTLKRQINQKTVVRPREITYAPPSVLPDISPQGRRLFTS